MCDGGNIIKVISGGFRGGGGGGAGAHAPPLFPQI